MYRKMLYVISVIMVASMVLAACAPAAATPQTIIQTQVVQKEGETVVVVATPEPTTPPAEPEPEGPGNVLRLSNGPGDIPTIDPALAVDVISIQIADETTVGLTRQNETTSELENAMATDVKISDDKLTYTFTIRTDVPWVRYDAVKKEVVKVQDCEGKDRMVTAQDFAYGILRTLNPKTASDYAYVLNDKIVGAADYNGGKVEDPATVGVKAIDDKTLEIKFTNPAAYNLNIASLWVTHAMPQWIIDGDDCTEGRNEKWIETGFFQGYGPFTLKEWVHDSSLTLIKNPFWPGDAVVPTAKIDEIHYSLIDSSASLAEYESGNMDVTSVPSGDFERIVNDPAFADQLRDTMTLGTEFYAFNTLVEPTDDVRVRQALSMALDREALVTSIWKTGKVAPYFTNPGCAGAPKTDKYPDLGVKFNPEKAKALLDEYLKEKGKTADQLNIVLMFNTSEANKKIAETAQQMWKDNLGINVQLTNQEWKVYLKARRDGKENIYRGSWVQDYPDANNFWADVWAPNGGYQDVSDWPVADYTKYQPGVNKVYDQFLDLIKQAAGEADPDKRAELYAQIEKIFVEDQAIVAPLRWYASKVLVSPRVKDTVSITGYDRFEKWEIK